ncbi:hypothetical protein GCM10010402_44030 [Actinomadura luteofluorescens]|uniref:O-methyltransferase n=1 Tax=Actinomadura luteofluorescens TaxID=46163 RepID=UPI002164F009|nr:O-methyltransferase [Actinomadura glauciflava]MCR3743623.1 hypothetical protein [Actinomadura glauciflava]
MNSTNYIDFSVRQNKAIERAIVFDGLRRLLQYDKDGDYVYIGFGSVWFVDFDMAHRELGIQTMLSIESDEVLFKRAQFNKPYRTIEVAEGKSYDLLPALLSEREDLSARPWIVWLDYDEVLDETKLDELSELVTSLPPNSHVITTFSAAPHRYTGKPTDRLERFKRLFGDAFPVERFETMKDLRDEQKVMVALGDAVIAFLKARSVQIARPGGFIPAFNLQYQDGTPMATAGGILPSPELAEQFKAELRREDWSGLSSKPIITPPLTPKEVSSLRALLPNKTALSREDIQHLGFDLLEDQIESFCEHYLKYPSFVQTAR